MSHPPEPPRRPSPAAPTNSLAQPERTAAVPPGGGASGDYGAVGEVVDRAHWSQADDELLMLDELEEIDEGPDDDRVDELV